MMPENLIECSVNRHTFGYEDHCAPARREHRSDIGQPEKIVFHVL
jgi:hypothetical protein